MSKWFEETFLPSLFDRIGANNNTWITQKQTAICTQNMERHTIMQAQFQGDYTRHNYFTCEWQGRKVTLQYSKLNGCGTINFGSNEAEKAVFKAQNEAEKIRLESERIERIKRKPERLEREVNSLKAEIEEEKEELISLYKELENPIEDTQEMINDIKKDIENTKNYLAELENKLAKFTT